MQARALTKKYFAGFFALVTSAALAGGISSGGTDNPSPGTGSAWFVGEQKMIHYCVESAADFPVPKTELSRMVHEAFGKWRTYVRVKHVFMDALYHGRYLAMDASPLERCDGSEDVTFFFGVADAAVEIARRNYQNPTAFAYRAHYDEDLGWAKGFVWFAPAMSVNPAKRFPNWKNRDDLFATILHEIGHVHGCSHEQGTIMMQDLSYWLEVGLLEPGEKKSIDRKFELSRCQDCTLSYTAPAWPGYEDAFRAIMGKPPVGKVAVTLYDQRSNKSLKHVLLFDGVSANELPITVTGTRDRGVAGEYSFFKIFTKHDSWESFPSEPEYLVGKVETPNGSSVMVSLVYNMGPGPMVLQYLDTATGYEKPLAVFNSNPEFVKEIADEKR